MVSVHPLYVTLPVKVKNKILKPDHLAPPYPGQSRRVGPGANRTAPVPTGRSRSRRVGPGPGGSVPVPAGRSQSRRVGPGPGGVGPDPGGSVPAPEPVGPYRPVGSRHRVPSHPGWGLPKEPNKNSIGTGGGLPVKVIAMKTDVLNGGKNCSITVIDITQRSLR